MLIATRLFSVAGLRPIPRSGTRLRIATVAGLHPVARDTSTLRVVAGLGTVAWISWILRSSHSVRMSPPPEILLDALRLREILSHPKTVDDHNDLPPAPGHILQPTIPQRQHHSSSAAMQADSASCTARSWDSLSGEIMTRSISTVTLDASLRRLRPSGVSCRGSARPEGAWAAR